MGWGSPRLSVVCGGEYLAELRPAWPVDEGFSHVWCGVDIQ